MQAPLEQCQADWLDAKRCHCLPEIGHQVKSTVIV